MFRTIEFDGQLVRDHAKFLVIDHRFLLVTSANFSRSAEFNNELGPRSTAPTWPSRSNGKSGMLKNFSTKGSSKRRNEALAGPRAVVRRRPSRAG